MKRSVTDVAIIILAIAMMAVGAWAYLGCDASPTAVIEESTSTPTPTPSPTPVPDACVPAYVAVNLVDADDPDNWEYEPVVFPLSQVPDVRANIVSKKGYLINTDNCNVPIQIYWLKESALDGGANCRLLGRQYSQRRALKCHQGGDVTVEVSVQVGDATLPGRTTFYVVQ